MKLRKILPDGEIIFPRFAKQHINDAYALLNSGAYITGM